MKRILLALSLAVLLPASGCQPSSRHLPRAAAAPALAEAVAGYVAAVDSIEEDIFSLMVLQDGKVRAEHYFDAHTPDDRYPMHSVSKTFTSMAVGMAVEEGLFSIDDKVVSFFPDKLPAGPSAWLQQMTVRDLLTMSCGHEWDPTGRIRNDKSVPAGQNDWIARFLDEPLAFEPGTYFCYNSLCTYLLSAIVQQKSGEKLLDFLRPRLFEPLDIDAPEWDESPAGITCGGWGLHLKTEDMAKFGQLLLDGGRWKGRKLIPAHWITEASSRQVDCRPAGTDPESVKERGLTVENSDWLQGYGYQIWRCRHNAYRAAGMNGQFIVVLPDKNAVMVVTAKVKFGMQKELQMLWDYLLPAL